MSALPVQKLFFGGLNYESQEGVFLLGRFKCYGKLAKISEILTKILLNR